MEITLSQNIRTFRKQRRLTQEQLAEVLGVTTGAVYKWESGMSVPDLSLIMEMADFFDVSVDVLLGYQMKDNQMDSVLARLSQYTKNGNREAINEAEKALKKYPNSFSLVQRSAVVYLSFASGEEGEKAAQRALQLLEEARKLLPQNTDPTISETTIFGEMATAYLMLGEYEKALELLRDHNAEGIFNDSIGLGLAMYLKRYEEAENYLSKAYLQGILTLADAMFGLSFVFCSRKDYQSAEGVLNFGLRFFSEIRKDQTVSFLSKLHAAAFILLSHTKLMAGNDRDARETVREACRLAQLFDAAPDYGIGTLRFASIPETVHIHDSLGTTAAESIERVIRLLQDEALLMMWKEECENV